MCYIGMPNTSDSNHGHHKAEFEAEAKRLAFLGDATGEDEKVIWLLRRCARVSIFFVGVILFFGICTLIYGVAFFAGFEIKMGNAYNGDWDMLIIRGCPDPYKAISILLSALEYFLLAPLCYLQLRTIADYMYGLLAHHDEEHPPPQGNPIMIKKKEMLSVKGLSIGLLIMILATNMIGVILKSHDGSGEFEWIKFTCGVGLLLVLTGYFYAIEEAAKE